MHKIKFGTDGWRGIIADNFTFPNVKIVAQALADYILSQKNIENGVVIGYDYRFLSEKFARVVAEVMASNNIPVILSNTAIPTPALVLATKEKKCAGGVMITASHNPPEYNGIKFRLSHGGSAPKEVTQIIESNLYKTEPKQNNELVSNLIKEEDLVSPYLSTIRRLVDLELIKRRKLKIIVDSMHGVGKNFLEQILTPLGHEVITIRSERNPIFGGTSPEPIPKNLSLLMKMVKETKADLGLATDGDADRVSVIDEHGDFVTPHHLIGVYYTYLRKARNLTGDLIRTVSVAAWVDQIVKDYNADSIEVPVGFKNVAEIMIKGERDVLLGGEESGGYALKNHIPDRDGALFGLLLIENLAYSGKSVSQLVDELEKRYGKLVYDRIDVHCPDEIRLNLIERLKSDPPDKIANFYVKNINTIDGIKFTFTDNSWVLVRASDTEPLVRIYSGSDSKEKTTQILQATKDLVFSH